MKKHDYLLENMRTGGVIYANTTFNRKTEIMPLLS